MQQLHHSCCIALERVHCTFVLFVTWPMQEACMQQPAGAAHGAACMHAARRRCVLPTAVCVRARALCVHVHIARAARSVVALRAGSCSALRAIDR